MVEMENDGSGFGTQGAGRELGRKLPTFLTFPM
jgi:hypothetical protein